MRWPIGWMILLLGTGCAGDDARDIPFWNDGMLLEGDCEAAIEATDAVTTLPLNGVNGQMDPLIKLDLYEGRIGEVVTREIDYHTMMSALNFGSYSVPDFNTHQVGAVFYDVDNACEVGVEQWHTLSKAGGGYVLEVTWEDSAMNCGSGCGLDTQGVIIVGVPQGQELSVCRRIRPGCDPNGL